MSVVSVPKLWMDYFVGVSQFAKYGTHRLLIVWELRKQRNANKCPKMAYSSVVKKTSIALLSQEGRAIASVQYLEHSFIISYFGFKFMSVYNSILFCYLRRNVEPCCHAHDSRSCIVRHSAWSVWHCRLSRVALGGPKQKAGHRCHIQPSCSSYWS